MRMLRTLPSEALRNMYQVFYTYEAESGLSLVEGYWKELREEHRAIFLQPLPNVFPAPGPDLQASQSHALHASHTDIGRLPELAQRVQPTRKFTESDEYNIVFNSNNSPIPRNALSAGLSTRDAAVECINSYLDDVQGMSINTLYQSLSIYWL